MDIDLLSKMVKELILTYDEVELPCVGTFIAEMQPASFSDKGYTINPPYRKLSFRNKLSGDDMLVRFYAANNKIDVGEADRILKKFLSELAEILRQKKLIIFPELGKLRATRENNFFFVADEDLDIFPEGFGLQPVSLKTHGTVSAKEESASDVAPEPEKTVEEVRHEIQEPSREEPVQLVNRHIFPKLLLSLVILAAIFFLALYFGGRYAPELVDKILYSPEQLDILYR